MVGNGGEIGQYFSRRLQTSGVNSPRRISRALDSDSFMELPKLPKPLQRALVFDHLEYARRYIPQGERSRTRVYILGSGGLEGPSGWIRKLPKLLEECRKIIHGSDFQFRDDWATVIDGRDEGVYEWVAANYAHGMLQNDPSDTIGVLTLGDQSAQVTFVSNVVPLPTDLYKIELQGTTHYLYSHGFAKLGLEAASEDLLNLMQSRNVSGDVGDTCTPRGYVIPKHNRTEASVAAERTGTEGTTEGIATEIKVRPVLATGNFTACRAESLRLLQMGQGITLVPEFRGNFIATRKFYQTSKYFSLPATATIADLVSAGEKYCNQEWGVGVSKDPYPEYKAVQKPCFSAAYIVAFLHDSLGLPLSDNKVMFTDAVNSVPVQFGLGFFTSKLLEENFVFSSPVVKNGELFGNLVLFLGLLAFCGVLLWFVARWRRPQLKTIYDLEKGRYITTAGRGR
uniref:Apyrase n=1 Tax=Physcomitrium patens TaxID=3218 RepID=A0A7I4CEH6_PHYPA